MPPKLTAAERAQFRAEAKNAAASEIRSKKRHSVNAAAVTPPTVTVPPPLPQSENLSPAKAKGKETTIVVADPPATRSKRPRGAGLLGIVIQEPSVHSAPPSPKKFKAASDWSLQSASQDLISPEEMKGVDLSLPAEASAFHRKPWAMTLDILQRLPTPTDRATFQSLEVTENIDNTMRNLFLVIHITHTFSFS